MAFTGCPPCAAPVLPPVRTRYQMIRPMKATRKIPPMASGRTGRSRVGLVRLGGRRFGCGRVGVFGAVLVRGLFFAEGTSFRVVRIPWSFLVPPDAQARPLRRGPNPQEGDAPLLRDYEILYVIRPDLDEEKVHET